MKYLEEGVQFGIAEMLNEKDGTNALILAMDNFLKVAKDTGFIGNVIFEIEESKAMLQEYISELNMRIELQKA